MLSNGSSSIEVAWLPVYDDKVPYVEFIAENSLKWILSSVVAELIAITPEYMCILATYLLDSCGTISSAHTHTHIYICVCVHLSVIMQ